MTFAITGTQDDFRRGYEDAYYWRRPSPNSALYLKGYERGVYVREVLGEKMEFEKELSFPSGI